MKLRRTEGSDEGGRKKLRAALIFGVVAATVEMGLLIWMAYC